MKTASKIVNDKTASGVARRASQGSASDLTRTKHSRRSTKPTFRSIAEIYKAQSELIDRIEDRELCDFDRVCAHGAFAGLDWVLGEDWPPFLDR